MQTELTVNLAASKTTTLLATADADDTSTGTGSYAATPIRASAQWGVSQQFGDFTWSYPFTMPPSDAGSTPSVGLSYDSQSIDGETGSTNNQTSTVGEGWSLSGGGEVDRTFESCATSDSTTGPINGSGDLCWVTNDYTVSFAGHSGALIQDASTGQWRFEGDSDVRVQHLTGTTNGTASGDYWLLTTPDGIKYYFGLNRLPLWSNGDTDTNSTDVVPVCGTPSNDCSGSKSTAGPFSNQAWSWNLDYVVDPNGNAEALYYTRQTNNYAEDGSGSTSYDRSSELTSIQYGLTSNNLYTGADDTEIDFGYAARCQTGQSGEPSNACDPTNPTKSDWPDTPWDQSCTSTSSCTQTSPSFFSTDMLNTVTTKITIGGTTRTLDTWTLQHSWPDPGDGTTHSLWLTEIDQTAGTGSSAITTPPTTFEGAFQQNRVWVTDGLAPLMKRRLTIIHSSSGATTTVTYSNASCTASMVPSLTASPQTNTHLCFPQWWQPSDDPAQLDWFNKYVVTQVTQDPETGGDGDSVQETDYDYYGTPAWRFDATPGILDSQRTWGQWAGYSAVEVRTGDSQYPALQHTVDYTYFQGLDNDPNGSVANPTSSQRSATVQSSSGTSYTDSLWWAGQQLEAITRNGSSGGSGESSTPIVSDVVTVPWASPATAQTSYHYSYTDPQPNKDGSHNTYTATLTQSAHLTGIGTTSTTTPLSTGGTQTVTATDSFDGYGRVTTHDVHTPDAGNTCTRTTYATNNSDWLINYPATVIKLGVSCSSSPTYPNDAISGTATGYDGQAVGVAPTQGNAQTIQIATSFASDGTPTWETSQTAAFDNLGRVITLTDPLATNGTASSPRVTQTSYTPVGPGPVTKTISTVTEGTQNLSTTTLIDPSLGEPTSVTDPNGNTTTTSYDALGRVTAIWAPNRPQSSNPNSPSATFGYTLSDTAPETISTTRILATGGTATSYQIYDGLGQLRQTQSPSEGGGIEVADSFYNSTGQAYDVTAPYYATGTPSGTLLIPDTSIPARSWTIYDGVGRTTASVRLGDSNELDTPTSNSELWRTTTAYPGADRTDVTPPTGGTQSSTFDNSLGETVKLTRYLDQNNPPSSTSTTYSYYPSGLKKSMTDGTGKNTWSWSYNLQGRVTSATDPDSGTTTTSYWPDGTVKLTSDAAGHNLYYTYDPLDRPLGEYSGTSSSGTQVAAWSYDSATNGLGLPATSTSYVGSTAYTQNVASYNTLGEPTRQSTTIGGSSALAGTYTTTATYEPDGSPATVTDPAGGGLAAETLTYGYDGLGNLTSLSSPLASYLTSITYTHLGQLGQLYQFQGAEQWRTYTWDTQTLRLDELFDQRYASQNATVSDDTYSYDNAGLLTEDSNRTEAAGTDTQCYMYDELGDLTHAWTPNSTTACGTAPTLSTPLGGPAPYITGYGVDPDTGNRTYIRTHPLSGTTITSTNTATYNYPAAGSTPGSGNGGPSAVSSITTTKVPTSGTTTTSTSNYAYDNDGSTTSLPGHTISYGAREKANSQTVNGATESDVYDATGQLLLTTDSTNGTTAYIGDTQYHAAAGSTTITASRIYSAAGQALAERDTTGTGNGTLYLLDTNPQNTSLATVSAATAAVSRTYQAPFGETRSNATLATTGNHGFLQAPQQLLTTSSTTTDTITQLGARQYDATLGRFLSVDPILEPDPGQINGYAYAENDPTSDEDPSGLCATNTPEVGESNRGLVCGQPDSQITHGERQSYPPSGPASAPIQISPHVSVANSAYGRQLRSGFAAYAAAHNFDFSHSQSAWANSVVESLAWSQYCNTDGSSLCGTELTNSWDIIYHRLSALPLAAMIAGRADSDSDALRAVADVHLANLEVDGGGSDPESVSPELGPKLLWSSWDDYDKTTIDGREYAQIGDRLYSQHAVDRMQPSGLGSPAGADGPGRSISPTFVEATIETGNPTNVIVNDEARTIYTSGSVQVVTAEEGLVVVTVNPFSG